MTLTLDAAATALHALRAESFYKLEHREIFTALGDLYEKNLLGDLVVLEDHLARKGKLQAAGGVEYLSTIINYVSTTANLDHHVRIVTEKAFFRRLIQTSTEITTQCFDPQTDINELIDRAEKKIFEIAQNRIESDFVSIKELIPSSVEKVEQLLNLNESVTGIETGFKELDQKTLGLQPSDMIVVASRPSMGKTSLAMNIAEHVALNKKEPVGVFSLEMSRDQLVFRMLCSHARVSIQKLRTGFISKSQGADLQLSAGRLSEAPVFIDDTPGISIMELRGKARRIKARTDCKLLIIDYLQLLTSHNSRGAEGRQQEISEISRSIKALARELKIPIIILSQLNRAVEQRTDHRPMLSDLRESGAIEQDADVVLLLTRKSYYDPEDEPGTADLILAKQRNGPTGDIKMQWNSEYTRFGNLSRHPDSEMLEETE
jgi:replicative DNA helicase